MRQLIGTLAAAAVLGLLALPPTGAQESRAVGVEANRSFPGVELDLALNVRDSKADTTRSLTRSAVSSVRLGEYVEVCFTASQDGWVTLWSKDAEGEFRRIYPNVFSHPGAEARVSVAVSAGERICVGDSDEFRLRVHRPLGEAEVYLHWAPSKDLQFGANDYPQIGRNTPGAAPNYASANIVYRVGD